MGGGLRPGERVTSAVTLRAAVHVLGEIVFELANRCSAWRDPESGFIHALSPPPCHPFVHRHRAPCSCLRGRQPHSTAASPHIAWLGDVAVAFLRSAALPNSGDEVPPTSFPLSGAAMRGATPTAICRQAGSGGSCIPMYIARGRVHTRVFVLLAS